MRKGMILALVLGIVLPWILSFLFLSLLSGIDFTELEGGFPQILAVLSFGSVAFSYNVPIFGYGYVIPLFIWLITGIFVGLFAKSTLKGALITFVGLIINVLLFVALNSVDPSFIPGSLQTAENAGLLSG